jgi:hypothetical protein
MVFSVIVSLTNQRNFSENDNSSNNNETFTIVVVVIIVSQFYTGNYIQIVDLGQATCTCSYILQL